MPEPGSDDGVRQLIGVELSAEDLAALVAQCASQARGVAAFPQADLKRVEPPLRSTPGPLR